MASKKYSDDKLTQAYSLLTDEQKIVLDEEVKRGKKTKWLNIWAKKKGAILSEEELQNTDMAMAKLLDWVLIDYEDSLAVNPNTKCECGRPLRYRYTVLHKSTGKIYKFGVIHFEQHTGLSSDLVRDITKGLKDIDLERDEILTKVIDNWSLPFNIPAEIEIDKDMTEQLRVKLPLLERQVFRLAKLFCEPLVNKKVTNKFAPSNKSNSSPTQLSVFSKGYGKSNSKNIFQNKENLPAVNLLNVDPDDLYYKLKAINISSEEAKKLFYFIKNSNSELKNHGLYPDEISKYVTKALGQIADPNTRHWLVEIECIYE